LPDHLLLPYCWQVMRLSEIVSTRLGWLVN
jgi:hypothetical protein